MTFVGIVATRDRLQVVTDSLTAKDNRRYLWTLANGKCLTIPHARVIASSSGDTHSGLDWSRHVLEQSTGTNGIEHLLERLDPAPLFPPDAPSTFYVAGWSPQEHRFRAWAFVPWGDRKPVELGPAHFSQHPASWATTDRVRSLFLEGLAADGNHWLLREYLAVMTDGTRQDIPETDEEWLEVIHAARDTVKYRVGPPAMRMTFYPLVGGTLRSTTMSPDGNIHEHVVATLDRPGQLSPELLRALLPSEHPTAQRAPCFCGSLKPRIDCHLDALRAGHPCTCGSGRLFESCCRLGVDPNETDLHDGIMVTTTHGTRMARWGTDATRDRQCPGCQGREVHELPMPGDPSWTALAYCRDCWQVWMPPPLPAVPLATTKA